MIKLWLKNYITNKYPDIEFDILIPPDDKMGDYSSNMAFQLAKKKGKNPEDIAPMIVEDLEEDKEINKFFEKIEFAKPGFINFYLGHDFLIKELDKILGDAENYGKSEIGKGEKINLEFVSANPTGPLTMGNVRAASFGDTLGNIMNMAGYEVQKEYYINDAGLQVRKLGKSVAKRALELKGEKVEFDKDLYPGEYVKEIAEEIVKENLTSIEGNEQFYDFCRKYAVGKLIESAKRSMAKLGVSFNTWFHESDLYKSGEVMEIIKTLEDSEYVYEKDEAKWFKVSQFKKDEDDAVIVKSNGESSYLIGDIAYTKNKFNRGFDRAINIWGADHYGDIQRLLAGVEALGYGGRLEILLHQLVSIKEKGEVKRMSKRAGKFVLLDDLIEEIGKEGLRYFFLTVGLNSHLVFDIGLAKSQSKENPVFYIQYAAARLSSVFNKLPITNNKLLNKSLKLLKEKEELVLMKDLISFPDLIADIAESRQVHHLTQYAFKLAGDIHKYYENHRIIQDDKNLEEARLALVQAVQCVLKSTLSLMGISTPSKM